MMSNDVTISVDKVGKKFCRSLKRTMVYGVRDVARDIFGIPTASTILRRDEFWALKDVSFEVKRGECLGLLGANGAGKSTLLKLLNGVILPDEGTISTHGRVGALLELGAGFHPMLTGRENIHLSGAIRGLTKQEIDDRFDAIVDFADLWDFIDTPVKYYSSGMYVRLGFALAVSVEPEILIIDEALAVGDAAFKRRCMERIDALIKAGKTIILVTHNLQEIERITNRVLLLDRGLTRADGAPEDVIADYGKLLSLQQVRKRGGNNRINAMQVGSAIEICEVDLCGDDGGTRGYFRTHEELQVRIRFVAHQPIVNPIFRVQIYRNDGLFCHGMNTERSKINLGEVNGEGIIVLKYPDLRLLQGDYWIRVSVLSTPYDELPIDELKTSQEIHVESKKKDGGGVFAMPAEW
ncbi:MAG: ABC transporter ATP-binding protein, partial [Deltaproteobacteria bacterium]|nr:ABC transporter ATP-binding protein [Deltaproteobacteria bacterium]